MRNAYRIYTDNLCAFWKRQGKEVGSLKDVKVAYVFSVFWIVSSTTMIILVIQNLLV